MPCGAGIEFLEDVAVAPDGTAFVTGCFEGSSTFGQGEPAQTTLDSSGGRDIFVAQYAADGSLIWARKAGGVDHDYGFGVAVRPDGAVFVSGNFGYGAGGPATFGEGEPSQTVLSSAGDGDIFVARYQPDGSLVWATSAGGAEYDSALSTAIHPYPAWHGSSPRSARAVPGSAGGT